MSIRPLAGCARMARKIWLRYALGEAHHREARSPARDASSGAVGVGFVGDSSCRRLGLRQARNLPIAGRA